LKSDALEAWELEKWKNAKQQEMFQREAKFKHQKQQELLALQKRVQVSVRACEGGGYGSFYVLCNIPKALN
jgi:hypothetical protein